MANYKITKRTIKDKDGNKKGEIDCIIADFENMTTNEKEAVKMYMQAGYKVFPKEAKKKSGKGLTKAKIETYLKENDESGFKEFQTKIRNKENFMKIMSWFKKNYDYKG